MPRKGRRRMAGRAEKHQQEKSDEQLQELAETLHHEWRQRDQQPEMDNVSESADQPE